ncbi:MAG TPA: 4a-hydroxytetrahydrobiopterin dehydratase [Bryobacteraceae bacterium]|nr:4a-hydroxytetrahydrobiopterin dehydratase [Bryobacteraceae bacterium]
MDRLTDLEIGRALTGVDRWVYTGKLHKEYVFPDFILAFGFMATAALVIEKLNHHPEWANVYNRVTVDLTTHDAGGVSARDFELARELDRIARRFL